MSPNAPTARTITLTYPADLSEWGRDIVEGTPFRAYLRRVHDTATAGDEWLEFVGVGCCGDSLDVPLVVEAVDGGDAIDEETRFRFRERDACGLAAGWEVQSEAGP